ncbi:MAG: hypothetical protein JWQ46_1295 [Phenylobacterium sp.]|nr:hypothetical protein [Phenylobacterium sp.]
MNRRAEIVGKSGQSYAFTRLEGEAFLRQIGVTYVIAAPTETGWRVLSAGETNNLADGSWRPALTAGRKRDPQAECLIRLNVSRSIREAEVSDIAVGESPT